MTNQEFEKKYNYRMADKCCGCCRHGDSEADGECACKHPDRDGYGLTDQCCICDEFEED